MKMSLGYGVLVLAVWSLGAAAPGAKLEPVATFDGPMPTGVTVSHKGRIFANFPRWGDPVTATVVEVKNGRPVPYPPGMPQAVDPRKAPKSGLVAVQSVVVDPKDRLWILDTGSVKFGPTAPGGPKLVGVDLTTDKVFKTITFPPSVVLKSTYLNDVRFDLRRGKGGFAFITDSSPKGENGIIVVDLATGESWRRLNKHPSTLPEPNFKPIVEGKPLMQDKPKEPPKPLTIGSDGIAISADGERLYYCALAGRKLYSVSVDALVDRKVSDADVAATVKDHGVKGASDGMESDSQNRVYVTDYERAAVHRRTPDGKQVTLVQLPKIVWPDTLSLANDGFLYVMTNQLQRQPDYHDGKDLRQKPYTLYRFRTDGKPVNLK